MGAVIREDRGAWWVFVNHAGRRTKRRLGTGKVGQDAAKLVAKTVNAQLALGDLAIFEPRKVATPEALVTFADYVPSWLETTVKARRKLGTVESYGYVMAKHWTPVLGPKLLTTIQREDVRKILGEWLSAGTKSSVVRLRLAILSSCFESAVDEGKMATNPCRGLRKWAVRSGEAQKTVEVFTRDEVRGVLAHADGWMAECVLLLARAGLRLGEALTVQWDDVDVAARSVWVRRTWSGARRTRTINAPKGNRERKVEMSQQLAKALLAYRDRLQVEALTRGEEPCAWVFPTTYGNPRQDSEFRGRWAALLQEAGVKFRTPHALRHTYATQLIQAGRPMSWVQAQLGHASIQETIDTYTHWVPGQNRDAVDVLDDLEVVAGSPA